MDEGCTCHLGHPPCGYCVEGTENYQEASALAEMLDDRELERLAEDIDRICDERAEKAGKKKARSAAMILPPPPAPHAPIAITSATADGLTTKQRVDRIGLSIKVMGLREKMRASMSKAMAIPSDPKPWGAFDVADRAFYETTNLGPKGDGAQWDNRLGRRAHS